MASHKSSTSSNWYLLWPCPISGKPLPECAQSYKMDQIPRRSGPTNVFGLRIGTHMPRARNGSHSCSARIFASAYGPITSIGLVSVGSDYFVSYTAVLEMCAAFHIDNVPRRTEYSKEIVCGWHLSLKNSYRRPMNPKPRVTLVRGPIVSTVRAANNEATPCIGLAYVAGYLRQHGYDVTIVDAIGEGLNRYWALDQYPGYVCQGLPFAEVIDRIPVDTDLIRLSALF